MGKIWTKTAAFEANPLFIQRLPTGIETIFFILVLDPELALPSHGLGTSNNQDTEPVFWLAES
jgi:hypothetical protein